MAHPHGYKSFADFERDALRPNMRAGWSLDELELPEQNELDFDLDPFEASLEDEDWD